MTRAPARIAHLVSRPPSESSAVSTALVAGIVGALYGSAVLGISDELPLWGNWSLATATASGAALVAALTAGLGYRSSRLLPEQSWRRGLPGWKAFISTLSAVLVHVGISAIAVIAVFFVLDRGFIGWTVTGFWGIVLAALCFGLTAYLVTLSVIRLNTARMSRLLMVFVVIGTVTAMLTTPDPGWWRYHFSQLGTFVDVSSFVFNGTLIVAGLLVTAFSVYIGHDLRGLAARGAVAVSVPGRVSALFAVMGVMLACVGMIPVNVSLILHNTAASGMAVVFLVLLCGGFAWLRSFPRVYALSSLVFLVVLIAIVLLFALGALSLTALEIIAFALIFGWISVFIRFLSAEPGHAEAPSPGGGSRGRNAHASAPSP